MLLSYLKIAARNLLKKKVFTIINILGLSVGAATSLMIFLYVFDELSYDTHLPNVENVYRMVEDRIYPDRVAYFTIIPGGFSTVLADEIPEVETSTRLVAFPNFAQVYRYNDKVFSEQHFCAADSNFFDVFQYRLLKGNPARVLRDTRTIVLTEATAEKYFGKEEPIGKAIQSGDRTFEVVGVMENVPENSHMKFDALVPTSEIDYLREANFYIAGTYTYVRLLPGTDPAAVDAKMPQLVDKYAAGQIERDLGVSYKKYVADGNGYRYFLQPLRDIHLKSHRTNELKANGDIVVVRTFIFVGLLILVIAGINFVNLATARSAERAKEVGVRKVLGSRKQQLVYQFLAESLLIAVVSIIVAVVIIQMSIGLFSTMSGKDLQLNFVDNPIILLGILLITLVLGVCAGLYPAFYISALKPVQVLKGKFQSSAKGNLLRNGLVVFQFTISVILISATLVVYDQLEYVQNKSLGFEKENVVVINHNGNDRTALAIKNELRSVPGVTSVGATSAIPGAYFFGMQFRLPGATEIFTPKGFTMDDHYAATLNMKVLDGRLFGPEFNDSLSVIVNQRAVRAMNLTNPVGTILTNNTESGPVSYTIVGVLEDFNFESLHTEIAPVVIMSTEGQLGFHNTITAKITSDNLGETLQAMEAKWKAVIPGEPFIYAFMDNRIGNLYSSEQSSGRLLTAFTVIAIIIACFGLFGLAAYTANQRTKEIGVRKVLGATVFGIVNLLSKDFARLVLIALVIGCPLAWFMMDRWLGTFAYRTNLSWITFALAGLVVMFFTILTISYQAFSAARVNPVKSLKDE